MKKDFWEKNPHLEVVHVTSDGEAFYNENDAKNHAKTLDEKAVEPVYNPAFLEVVGAEEETRNEVPNLGKLNKADLVQFCKDNGFDVDETHTKAKILESIDAQLAEQEKAGEVTIEDENKEVSEQPADADKNED